MKEDRKDNRKKGKERHDPGASAEKVPLFTALSNPPKGRKEGRKKKEGSKEGLGKEGDRRSKERVVQRTDIQPGKVQRMDGREGRR